MKSVKTNYGSGCNVKVGKYGTPSKGGDVKSGNGTFGDAPSYAGTHRMSTGVLKVKGHHRGK